MSKQVSSGPPGYDDQNLLSVANYLFQHGYSKAAAAGVAGCIAGESGGNPESSGSGGDGLIGWTPPSTGPRLTGNAQNDLKTQEAALIQYNNRNGAVSGFKKFSGSPVAAADQYSQQFERPAVTNSDVRASVAQWVYGQISGTGGTGAGTTPPSSSDPFTNIAKDLFGGILGSIGISDPKDFLERAGLVLLGLVLLLFGVIKITGNDPVRTTQNALGGSGGKKKSSSKSSGKHQSPEEEDKAIDRKQDKEVREYNKKIGGREGGKARGLGVASHHEPGLKGADVMPEEVPF